MAQNDKKYFIKNDIKVEAISQEQLNYHTEQPIKNEIQPLPGEYGFGVAVNDIEAAKIGLKPMTDHKNVKSENFGNYTDENGSVFVCIPRFYYKINQKTIPELDDWNEIDYSIEYKEGFVTPLAFRLYHGDYLDCVFVAKYQTSMENFKLISKKNTMPAVMKILDYRGNLLPENARSLSFVNHPDFIQDENTTFLYKMYNIVKKQNKNLQIHHNLLRFVYVLTCLIHVQNCYKKYTTNTPNDLCGFMNKKPYFPRGMNGGSWVDSDNNWHEGGWFDVDDNTVTFTPSYENAPEPSDAGYTPALTGSSSDLTKTSHNGQLCGIQDLNGNMWETDIGLYLGENILMYDAINAVEPLKSYSKNDNIVALTTSNIFTIGLNDDKYTSGSRGLLCGDMFRNYFTDNAMYFYPDQITDKYSPSANYNKNKFGGDWQGLNQVYDFNKKRTGSYSDLLNGKISSLSYGGRQRNGTDNGLYTMNVAIGGDHFYYKYDKLPDGLKFTGFEANTIRLMMHSAKEINYKDEILFKLITTPSQLIKLLNNSCYIWKCFKSEDKYVVRTCLLDKDNLIADWIPELEQQTTNLFERDYGANIYDNYIPELDSLCSKLKEKLLEKSADISFNLQNPVIHYEANTKTGEIKKLIKVLTPQIIETPSILKEKIFKHLSNSEFTTASVNIYIIKGYIHQLKD